MSAEAQGIQMLVLTVAPPARLMLFRHDRSGPLEFVEGTSVGTWPPWPVAPDILARGERQSFVGLSCGVGERYEEYVGRLSSTWDSSVFRLNTPSSGFPRDIYEGSDDTYLEILWGESEPDALIPAQLAEDRWYYVSGSPAAVHPVPHWREYLELDGVNLATSRLFAVGLAPFGWILEAFHLEWPSKLRLSAEIMD